jgi:hypothetical protein
MVKVVAQHYFSHNDYIDSVLVYREGRRANMYNQIGSFSLSKGVEYNDLNSFTSQQEYRYKISFKDSCGQTSDLSALHKTMYLSMSKGHSDNIWNLSWTPYIGIGEIATYEIFRGTTPENMEPLNFVSGNTTTFSDFNAPTGSNLYYQIRISNVICSRNNDTEIRSNLIFYNTLTNAIDDQAIEISGLNVYPNPNNGNFRIELPNNSSKVQIYNILGHSVYQSSEIQEPVINIQNLNSGIYTLVVFQNGVEKRQNIIVR